MQKRNIARARNNRSKRNAVARAIVLADTRTLDQHTHGLIATEGENAIKAYLIMQALDEMGYQIVKKPKENGPC